MKYLNKFLTILLLIFLSWLTSGYAQQGSIDANRMTRDINIMENILEEMFKIQSRSGARSYVIAGNSIFSSGRDVKGTYLPGYGVIFTIPTGNVPLIYSLDNEGEGEATGYSFVYSSDEAEDNKVDEETITQKIKEFLKDYGSTIGQLQPDEHVMVIYGHDLDEEQIVLFDSEGERRETTLPVISVATTKNDLEAYRSGKINVRQFDERISISKLDRNSERRLDLEVMANIFKTAFRESGDESSFRVRGSVNHLKLDNFGALFFFDVSYSSSSSFTSNVFRLRAAPKPEVQTRGDAKSRARVEILRELDREIEEEQKEREKKEKELKVNTRNAFNDFKTQIKEYMIDYGRTLRSVDSDQFVMASITVSSRVPDIPERIDVQVKKSVLEAVDRGSMSRNDALDRVMIREY